MTAFLIALFAVEFAVFTIIDYHHKPNEIVMGQVVSALIFINSSIVIILLMSKTYYKWAIFLALHSIGFGFVAQTTTDLGFKRYLDSEQDTWEYHHDEIRHIVRREKEYDYIEIFQIFPNQSYNTYKDLLSGQGIKIEYGWKIMNDSVDVRITPQMITGLPTERDTFKLRKIYY